MALTIIRQGVLDTVQDRGRFGHADAGINPGGVMDRYASSVANSLVGNNYNEPLIEMHFPAPQIMFREDALIAICGADFNPSINEEPIPCWQPVAVKKNSLLHFSKWKWGARAYLAVHGQLECTPWLNSCSTNLKAAMGGHCGRALMKSDVIKVKRGSFSASRLLNGKDSFNVLHWGIPHHHTYKDVQDIHMIHGPEWELMHESSKQTITDASFTIDPRSDRMAYMLDGELLQLQEQFEMVSSGVDYGTIQLLPGGQLVILMADHQTTGGYPRIGNIIGAHLPKLSQLGAGASFRLSLTDVRTAEQMLFSQERDLRTIQWSCLDHLNQLHAQYRS